MESVRSPRYPGIPSTSHPSWPSTAVLDSVSGLVSDSLQSSSTRPYGLVSDSGIVLDSAYASSRTPPGIVLDSAFSLVSDSWPCKLNRRMAKTGRLDLPIGKIRPPALESGGK